MSNWIQKYNQGAPSKTQNSGEQDDFDLFFEMSEFDQEPVDVDAAWTRVHAKLAPQRSVTPMLLRIAAILVVIFGLGYVITQNIDTKAPATISEVIALDKLQEVILPDGSVVTLSKNSQIQYEESGFPERRAINLKGEAHFNVSKGSVPFIISSTSGKVTVLGTSFNLNTRKGLQLLVTSGTVRVETQQDKRMVYKGQLASVQNQGTIQVVTAPNNNALGWKTGQFKFENEPLDQVLPLLERYYQVKISTSKSIRQCKITAEFDETPLENVVDIISTILNAKSHISGDNIKFSGKGCN
ncbi:MAG: FecR domain-containing protein [Marinoscillum sp.]|uniref:FecR family protein n=1 Tax=Marinoscillum sp. TaxID=2024838 RepID=UPI0032FF9D98